MKLNLGCGEFPLEGFVNIDRFGEGADVKGNFLEMEFQDVEEIVLSHVLEHIPHAICHDTLTKLYGWLAPEGKLTVEVPDMEAIFSIGTNNPAWVTWVYGVQSHPGEFHFNGFTSYTLVQAITAAGFGVATTWVKRFMSEHPARTGFPCIEVIGAKI